MYRYLTILSTNCIALCNCYHNYLLLCIVFKYDQVMLTKSAHAQIIITSFFFSTKCIPYNMAIRENVIQLLLIGLL